MQYIVNFKWHAYGRAIHGVFVVMYAALVVSFATGSIANLSNENSDSLVSWTVHKGGNSMAAITTTLCVFFLLIESHQLYRFGFNTYVADKKNWYRNAVVH